MQEKDMPEVYKIKTKSDQKCPSYLLFVSQCERVSYKNSKGIE